MGAGNQVWVRCKTATATVLFTTEPPLQPESYTSQLFETLQWNFYWYETRMRYNQPSFKALGVGKGMCPSEDSRLAFLAPCSRNKGRVRKEGACPSNQGLPVMVSVETMVFIWAKERPARKWQLGFEVAPWLG